MDVLFDRITSDSAVLGGKPCIRGTRISVEMVLEWLASGAGTAEITKAYPQLAPTDVEQAIRYAARFLSNEVVIHAEVSG